MITTLLKVIHLMSSLLIRIINDTGWAIGWNVGEQIWNAKQHRAKIRNLISCVSNERAIGPQNTNVTESSCKKKWQFYVISSQVHQACCAISRVEENDLMSGQSSVRVISQFLPKYWLLSGILSVVFSSSHFPFRFFSVYAKKSNNKLLHYSSANHKPQNVFI